MIKCDVIQDLLPLYVDDVASKGSRTMVDEHIKSCSDCQEFLENMKSISFPDVTSMDELEIGALKTMKRKIRRTNNLIASSSIACAIIVFCVIMFYHTPVSFEASNIEVSPSGRVITIRNDGFDSLTGILIDDAFYFNVRSTIFTRYISPLIRGDDIGHGRFSFYDIGGGKPSLTNIFGNVDFRNNWTIPVGMDINAGDINRVYYLQGNLHRLASDPEAFERVKGDAVLVWDRRQSE